MTLTYREAGVDLNKADALVERIKPLAFATRIPEVLEDIGGFAGLCRVPEGIEEPILVSGTDGVGTKLKLAIELGAHDTIGQDLVAMCVNDVLTVGARPLFFLDYFACGKLDVEVATRVIAGIAEGCKLGGCALIGGETAELPGMYGENEYDLAGFAVGVVGKREILGAKRVLPSDVLVAVASSGLHSNGYSLARRVFSKQAEPEGQLERHGPVLGGTLAETLMKPTTIYTRVVGELKRALGPGLHALSHITGGGIVGNLPRVLPAGVVARAHLPSVPEIFELIRRSGPVNADEMKKTFNLGVGLIAVVAREAKEQALSAIDAAGLRGFELGALEAAPGAADPARVVLDWPGS